MSEAQVYGVASFLRQADAVAVAVLVILLLMSIASWYLIVLKAIRNTYVRNKARAFLSLFWGAPSLEAVATELRRNGASEPFGRTTLQGMDAVSHFRKHGSAALTESGGQGEFLTRAVRRAINRETAALESGLTMLASVGSTAPFVGLFGTVWGIYHALIGIGVSGKATLDTVAGPVGEALIMTATGLSWRFPQCSGTTSSYAATASCWQSSTASPTISMPF